MVKTVTRRRAITIYDNDEGLEYRGGCLALGLYHRKITRGSDLERHRARVTGLSLRAPRNKANVKPKKVFRIVIIGVALALIGCSKTLVPKERTAIFSQERAPNLLRLCLKPPEGVTAFWTPNDEDLTGIEDHLEEYLAAVWAGSRNVRKEMPEWKSYYRQVGGIVKNGEKLLFISYSWAPWMKDPQIEAKRKKEAEMNGRRYDPDWWKTEIISVYDGGSGVFRVIYDPKKKQFVWYDQNGPA